MSTLAALSVIPERTDPSIINLGFGDINNQFSLSNGIMFTTAQISKEELGGVLYRVGLIFKGYSLADEPQWEANVLVENKVFNKDFCGKYISFCSGRLGNSSIIRLVTLNRSEKLSFQDTMVCAHQPIPRAPLFLGGLEHIYKQYEPIIDAGIAAISPYGKSNKNVHPLAIMESYAHTVPIVTSNVDREVYVQSLNASLQLKAYLPTFEGSISIVCESAKICQIFINGTTHDNLIYKNSNLTGFEFTEVVQGNLKMIKVKGTDATNTEVVTCIVLAQGKVIISKGLFNGFIYFPDLIIQVVKKEKLRGGRSAEIGILYNQAIDALEICPSCNRLKTALYGNIWAKEKTVVPIHQQSSQSYVRIQRIKVSIWTGLKLPKVSTNLTLRVA